MAVETFEGAVCAVLTDKFGEWEDDTANGVSGRVAYDGLDPDPKWAGSRFAVMQIEWQSAEAMTTAGALQLSGADGAVYRHEGSLLVWILGPAGGGVGKLIEAAGRLSNVFRGWFNPTGLPQVWMSAPYLQGAPQRNGPDMQVSWRCPFTAFGDFGSNPA